jgi:hypothetical protein
MRQHVAYRPKGTLSFGFRKSIRIAPGVRLNASKRSVGVSVGPRGAKVSANTGGRRGLFLGLLGLFYRRRL